MYQRIKFVATLALLPLVVYLVYYPYNSIQNTLDFAFFEPVRWVQNGWAEQGVKIAFGTRMTYAVAWLLPVFAGLLSVVCAVRILWLLRKGEVFSERIAWLLSALGWGTVLSNVLHLIAAAFTPMMISWHNTAGPEGVRFWYNSSHVGMIFYGLGFVLIGWVIREGQRLAQENDGFL